MRDKIIKFMNSYSQKEQKFITNISNIKSKVKFDKTIFFIFISIFIMLYFVHSVIYMYFDDFGNASISYSYWTPNVDGTNYTISQLFEWAGKIYMQWGGRILYAIAFIIPLLKNGISAYMFVQSIVITALIYYMYKIVCITTKSKENKTIIPITLISLYMCIDMMYLRDGIYWASASVLYIWPILPLMAFIYYFIKANDKFKNKEKYRFWYIPLLVVLGFLATFSQEQIGSSVVVFTVIYIVSKQFKKWKKYLILDIPVVSTVIISFLVLFFAPGNWVRMDSNEAFANLSIIGKIMCNFPKIMQAIFIEKMNIYMYILTGIMFFMILSLQIEKSIKENKKAYTGLVVIIPILLGSYFLVCKTVNHKLLGISVFGVLWFLSMLITTIFYLKDNKSIEVVSIEFSAISSIFCLCMSPTVGGRTGIPYMLMIILLCVIFIKNIVEKGNVIIKSIIYIMIAIILLRGINITIKNYNGYKHNYGVHQLNFELLQHYKVEDGDTITLYKIGNSLYGSTLSYDEPSMDFWIKEYFNIPQNVTFKWIDIYEKLR